MINREEFLTELKRYKEKQIIKVVTGVRRCGKSTLFALYIEYLKSLGVLEEQIININLEDIENEELLDYKKLHSYIKELLCKDKFTYVFIDEVQQCKEFEKAVNSLFLDKKVDIYITGSNAYMLSGELATLLSGRYIEIKMLPLSFKEYYATCDENVSLQVAFNDFLKFGTFPYITKLEKTEQDVHPYIEGIYNTILVKDVATRNGITDISVLERIVKFLAGSIGSLVSAKKISDYLCSNGRKISVNTVDNYLKAVCDSYIFYKALRYDIKGKELLKTLAKYYIVDNGLRNYLLKGNGNDLGHLIENVVYLELLRRGYDVKIGKVLEKEVDFVARDNNGVLYIQVSASVLDDTTLCRELAPFQKIYDGYPKILLTLDEIGSEMNYNGVRQQNLLKWLIE